VLTWSRTVRISVFFTLLWLLFITSNLDFVDGYCVACKNKRKRIGREHGVASTSSLI